MRKRILSTPICIWVELETRTYSYLPKHSVEKRDSASQWKREKRRQWEVSLCCAFYDGIQKFVLKDFCLQTSEQAKSAEELHCFSHWAAVRLQRGGKTTGISQAGHRQAHVLLIRTHVARICHAVSWQRICFARFIRICKRLRLQSAEDDEPQITICTRTSDALSPSARLWLDMSCQLPSACLLPSACCLLWPDPGPALCAVPTGHA